MPSPFPGMNPYLEQAGLWQGVPTALLGRVIAALTPLLVPRYFAELEESLYIDPNDDSDRLFAVADVAVAGLCNTALRPPRLRSRRSPLP